MAWHHWGALVTLAVTGFYIARTVYRLVFHPLSKIPGPWYLIVSTLPHSYYGCLSGNWPKISRQLHEKYGTVVRIGPNRISVKGEIGWKEVYGHKPHGTAEWCKWPDFFSGVPSDLLIAPTADHRRMRKPIIRAFSDKAIQELEPVIRQYSTRLITILKERDSTVIDMCKWWNLFTFDLFGDLAFGEPFGSLEGQEYHPWVALVVDTIKLTKQFRIFDEAKWLIPLVRALTPKDIKRRAYEHHTLSRSKVKKRIEQGTQARTDFMSYIWDKEGEKFITRTEMESISGLFIAAGSETTGTSLAGFVYYLLKNPDKYTTLVDEIRTKFKDGDDGITLQSTSDMPYLQACVEEGLRLFPPVPIGAPRQVPPGGDYLNGVYLPGKTLIEVPQWATHRAMDNFTDPDNFIPERWLNPEHPLFMSKYKSDNKSVVQPFSYGPRNCAGKALAYHEMRFIICLFFNNFDIELQAEADGWVERCENYFLWEKPPLPVKVMVRK